MLSPLKLVGLILLVSIGNCLYCKPFCNSNTGCVTTYDGCTGSCKTPYTLSGGSGCSLAATSNVFTTQLPSDTAFTVSGYISNSVIGTQSCNDGNTYHMMGPFGTDVYVFKEFSGLGTSHYQVDVFWSYGVFGGTWTGQALSAIFTDSNGVQSALANQGQTCASTTALVGCTGSVGCFNNYKQTVTHNSDYLSVNFSSFSSAITVSQSWAVNNLYLVLALCEATCLTCTGPAHNQCLSCIAYLFLQGSVCILSCPFFTMADTRVCVSSCPAYYVANSYNNFCQLCPNGCITCISNESCVNWDEDGDPSDSIIDLLPLWITLCILIMAILAVLIWKFCLSKKNFNEKMEEEVIDHRKEQKKQENARRRPRVNSVNNVSNQTIEARWLEDIDSLHNTKIGIKPAKNNVIQGIGRDR